VSTNRETCFVIMPFSKTTDKHTEDYWTKHFKTFLKPLIEENPNLEARRSKAMRGDILREIITDLVVSPVVVADLTDNNPNVYWELGVRQSFKHGTITIAEEGTQLPFDIGGKGTLFYYLKDHLKMEDFRKRFKEAIKDCLVHSDRPDSHVLDTLSGRGTLFEIFRRDEAIRRLDAVLSECSRNLVVLKDVADQARDNQEKTEEREFTTDRFRVSAVELLITNRYVDEDQPFFTLAEEYSNEIVAINDQLSLWESSPNATETWLLNQKGSAAKLLKNFRAKVVAARKKLSKQF
jgi:hypothetical protein